MAMFSAVEGNRRRPALRLTTQLITAAYWTEEHPSTTASTPRHRSDHTTSPPPRSLPARHFDTRPGQHRTSLGRLAQTP